MEEETGKVEKEPEVEGKPIPSLEMVVEALVRKETGGFSHEDGLMLQDYAAGHKEPSAVEEAVDKA